MVEKNTIQSDFLRTRNKDLAEKAERIATAVYLVSALITDKEPLKWQMREKVLETMSQATGNNDEQVLRCADELVHLIALAHRGALISPMNAELLDAGVRNLIQTISNAPLFDRNFLRFAPLEIPDTPSQGQIKDMQKTEKSPQETSVFKRQAEPVKRTLNRKDKRRDQVIEALKKKRESSIKDIARLVKGCSEKTIQRELNNLIAEGSVSKKGERRWSTYVLSR